MQNCRYMQSNIQTSFCMMCDVVVFRAVRRNISGRECLYADGGILDQYPISVFDGKCIVLVLE